SLFYPYPVEKSSHGTNATYACKVGSAQSAASGTQLACQNTPYNVLRNCPTCTRNLANNQAPGSLYTSIFGECVVSGSSPSTQLAAVYQIPNTPYAVFNFTVDHPRARSTMASVSISADGGNTFSLADVDAVTPSLGTVSLDASQYQIGESDQIKSNLGTVTLMVTVDTTAQVPIGTSNPNVQFQVEVKDSGNNTTTVVSQNNIFINNNFSTGTGTTGTGTTGTGTGTTGTGTTGTTGTGTTGTTGTGTTGTGTTGTTGGCFAGVITDLPAGMSARLQDGTDVTVMPQLGDHQVFITDVSGNDLVNFELSFCGTVSFAGFKAVRNDVVGATLVSIPALLRNNKPFMMPVIVKPGHDRIRVCPGKTNNEYCGVNDLPNVLFDAAGNVLETNGNYNPQLIQVQNNGSTWQLLVFGTAAQGESSGTSPGVSGTGTTGTGTTGTGTTGTTGTGTTGTGTTG